MKRIFFTGAPGSRWSGIAQELESHGGFDISDRTPSRSYYHNKYSGHLGAYFGTGMEFPAILDTKNLDLPYSGAGIKLHKSHEWSLMLDNINDFYPKAGIILVYRPSQSALNWWLEAGGFDITYPKYNQYKDIKMMLASIRKQNDSMLKFAHKHKLSWSSHHKHHDILITKKLPW